MSDSNAKGSRFKYNFPHFQCLGKLNDVQKNLDKISAKYTRIAALWKKGI